MAVGAIDYDASVLRRLRDAWRKVFGTPSALPQIDPALHNLDPGCLDFIRVAKRTNLATLVEEDRLKYRPRGFK